MRSVRVLAAAAFAAGLVGCAADREGGPVAAAPTPGAPGAASSVATASPVPTGSAAPAQTRPSRAATGLTSAPPPGKPAVSPPPSDPDRPGDLVRGVRTLRGVVERQGTWVLLRLDGHRWALLGDRARTLGTGTTVEVQGTVTAPPVGCPADQALTVTRLT
jgi:hypothetical protein